MAHKGYTLNYFLNFFKNIPSNRFESGYLANDDGTRMCALGHAGSADRDITTFANSNLGDPDGSGLPAETRAVALNNFLDGQTADINDGDNGFETLGKTPRTRILRALRNRKSKGSVL